MVTECTYRLGSYASPTIANHDEVTTVTSTNSLLELQALLDAAIERIVIIDQGYLATVCNGVSAALLSVSRRDR